MKKKKHDLTLTKKGKDEKKIDLAQTSGQITKAEGGGFCEVPLCHHENLYKMMLFLSKTNT